MKDKAEEKIAVIGRNLSAALALEALLKAGYTKCFWFQSEDEANRKDYPQWSFRPSSPETTLAFDHQSLSTKEAVLYFGGRHRLNITELVNSATYADLHPALRKRILAVLLWNDLSPPLWNGSGQPDDQWTSHDPISQQGTGQSYRPLLLPCHLVLKELETELQDKGVIIGAADQSVLGVKLSSNESALIHNAPYGFTSVDKVIWASFSNTLRFDEGKKTGQKSFAFKPIASWKNYASWVHRRAVTSLPTLSFWIDPKRFLEFKETGIFGSGLFKKVLVIRDGDAPLAWLQIEDLEIADESSYQRSERIDSFLWNICPYLESESLSFSNFQLFESHFFEKPLNRWQEPANNLYLWHPGTLGSPTELIQKYFPTKVKKVLEPQPKL